MNTDYIYNKLNYKEFVSQSHNEMISAKLKRISGIIKTKINKEIRNNVNKHDLRLNEISKKLRSLIHGNTFLQNI